MEPGIVRATGSRRRAEEWGLVLEAEGLTCEVVHGETGGWWVRVDDPEAGRARALLDAYDAESTVERRDVVRPPDRGPTTTGLVAAALVVVCFRLSGPRAGRSAWFQVGSLTPAAVGDEPWRLVTALTLHADAAHCVANVLSGGVLVTLLARVLGPGLAAWVLLAAGAGGNALSVMMHGPGYSAVGASTAVLGAVGALAGIGMRWRPAFRALWVPLAAGLGLLAMLGSGEGTDLGAHAGGFVAGIPLGASAARRRLPDLLGMESLVAMLAAGVVGLAWWAAFAWGSR